MKNTIALLALAAMLCGAPAAIADTLYVAPPGPAGPGHPLRLGPDLKAHQPGDLVNIVFNFNVAQNSSSTMARSKAASAGLVAGTGIGAPIGFLKFPSSIGGSSALNTSDVRANSQTFTSAMMATVQDILPSGALVVTGVQRIIINGKAQNMKVTGTIRAEDIDQTDSVLSTSMANVQLDFDGNFGEDKKGIIRRIIDWIF
ncbi:MAG: flagellar basal body L-ring protein FlgH [Candidatus Eremiobacteraeota bacterium]|nr:flagellar basal body L-ring protein FlgH [Candidatus Eremiobacteraeota bacterium]